MLIRFDAMEESTHLNFKGGEGTFFIKAFQDEHNKIMNGRLAPGSSIGLHTHETNSEMFYIISGTGKVLCDGVYEPLKPGDVHYCPMGHAHSLINDGEVDLVVFGTVPEHRDVSKD